MLLLHGGILHAYAALIVAMPEHGEVGAYIVQQAMCALRQLLVYRIT
jgi:hypothetical protein